MRINELTVSNVLFALSTTVLGFVDGQDREIPLASSGSAERGWGWETQGYAAKNLVTIGILVTLICVTARAIFHKMEARRKPCPSQGSSQTSFFFIPNQVIFDDCNGQKRPPVLGPSNYSLEPEKVKAVGVRRDSLKRGVPDGSYDVNSDGLEKNKSLVGKRLKVFPEPAEVGKRLKVLTELTEKSLLHKDYWRKVWLVEFSCAYKKWTEEDGHADSSDLWPIDDLLSQINGVIEEITTNIDIVRSLSERLKVLTELVEESLNGHKMVELLDGFSKELQILATDCTSVEEGRNLRCQIDGTIDHLRKRKAISEQLKVLTILVKKQPSGKRDLLSGFFREFQEVSRLGVAELSVSKASDWLLTRIEMAVKRMLQEEARSRLIPEWNLINDRLVVFKDLIEEFSSGRKQRKLLEEFLRESQRFSTQYEAECLLTRIDDAIGKLKYPSPSQEQSLTSLTIRHRQFRIIRPLSKKALQWKR